MGRSYVYLLFRDNWVEEIEDGSYPESTEVNYPELVGVYSTLENAALVGGCGDLTDWDKGSTTQWSRFDRSIQQVEVDDWRLEEAFGE